MRLRDTTAPVQILTPATVTADGTTRVVDRYGWDSVAFDLLLGSATGLDSSNRLVFTLKASDTETGTFEAVATTDLDELLPEIDANGKTAKCYRVEYLGTKRFLRLDFDVTGSVSLPMAVVAQLGGPQSLLYGRPSLGL